MTGLRLVKLAFCILIMAIVGSAVAVIFVDQMGARERTIRADINEQERPDQQSDSDWYHVEDSVSQRRMADATEGQVVLLGIEVALLITAVAIAFWAGVNAKRAADATAEILRTESEMLRAQRSGQSAWLAATDMCGEKADADPVIRFRLKWRNKGVTPARRVRIGYGGVVSPAHVGDPPIRFSMNNKLDYGAIAQGEAQNLEVSFNLDELGGAVIDGQVFVIWSRIEFTDVFGSNRHSQCKLMALYEGDFPINIHSVIGDNRFKFVSLGSQSEME